MLVKKLEINYFSAEMWHRCVVVSGQLGRKLVDVRV